jgi:DNA-binding response OmpR family regulator
VGSNDDHCESPGRPTHVTRQAGSGNPGAVPVLLRSTPRRHAASGAWGEQAYPDGRIAGAGKLALDVGRLAADAGYGPVSLARLEFLLLKELAEHGVRLAPRARLLAAACGFDFDYQLTARLPQ